MSIWYSVTNFKICNNIIEYFLRTAFIFFIFYSFLLPAKINKTQLSKIHLSKRKTSTININNYIFQYINYYSRYSPTILQNSLFNFSAAFSKLIHFPEKINSCNVKPREKGLQPSIPLNMQQLFPYVARHVPRSPCSWCFVSYLDTGRENGKFSVRKLMLTWRDRVTSRLIKYATIISARSRTRSRLPILRHENLSWEI